MALTNLPIKENYDCSKIIENGQIVVLNSPLVIYSPSTSDDCSLVLNSCRDNVFAQNLSEIVLDPKYFKCEHEKNASPNYDLSNIIDLRSKNEVHEGLEVLEIFSSPECDKPELIDISKLSEIANTSNTPNEKDPLELSDDEVIFVKEYKETESEKPAEKTVNTPTNDSNIRRNPVRNVRNKSRNLSKELLFEEDFAFLDTSDDDIEDKENQIDKKPVVKLPKEWPINVHERPEYNAVTKKIECFDYTIREIQNKATPPAKKPKTEPVAAVRKNLKKKSVVRRRRKPAPVPVKATASLENLKPLINSTTDMLKEYFVSSKKHKDIISSKSPICTFENKLEILKNQAFLFAIVNNLDEKEVVDKFKHLNLDHEAKS